MIKVALEIDDWNWRLTHFPLSPFPSSPHFFPAFITDDLMFIIIIIIFPRLPRWNTWLNFVIRVDGWQLRNGSRCCAFTIQSIARVELDRYRIPRLAPLNFKDRFQLPMNYSLIKTRRKQCRLQWRWNDRERAFRFVIRVPSDLVRYSDPFRYELIHRRDS